MVLTLFRVLDASLGTASFVFVAFCFFVFGIRGVIRDVIRGVWVEVFIIIWVSSRRIEGSPGP